MTAARLGAALGFALLRAALAGAQGSLPAAELEAMTKAMAADRGLRAMMSVYGDAQDQLLAFQAAVGAADEKWKAEEEALRPIEAPESTAGFELLPLVEWFTDGEGLKGESGVSYLLRTDGATILFDLGLNRRAEDPSPLLSNMAALGIAVGDIDTIVISHPHEDHVGGGRWRRGASFSLGASQLPLDGKRVFTPSPMVYPGLEPVFSEGPTRIAEGVYSSGVISCPFFFGGAVGEQALFINLRERGIVIVTGCGHPTAERLVARARKLFDLPIYAILGGLHLPLTAGRNIEPYYRYYLSGRLPWEPLVAGDVAALAASLKAGGLKVVGLSGHDSCDESLGLFKKAFGEGYREIAVGRPIHLP
jgi:7,8-dihydropterin-6-yl-methyl-4-(beta-D-ribofuranosyl)aminobenzene 5'-phosphate synthase